MTMLPSFRPACSLRPLRYPRLPAPASSLAYRLLPLLALLPLAAIGLQSVLGFHGIAGYSLYKLFFLIPPWIYCRVYGIGIRADILNFQGWRRGLPGAIGLGLLAVAIFWGAYAWLGDLLLDQTSIAGKIRHQFGVTSATVLFVAPVTIFVNSLLEEFFYRGLVFGQWVRRNRFLAYLVPAIAFTLQHLLFIHSWVTPLSGTLATFGLLVFALVLERSYEITRSIVTPWVIHIFGDVAMMGIAVTMLS